MSAADNIFVDAAACGDLNGIKELLANQTTTAAQVNALDKDGRSAFHYACLNDDINLLKVLLADNRVDTELKSPKGDTCMHLAALYACLEVLKILFNDVRTSKLLNAKNQWGETPLHLCAGSGDKGASRAALLLLEAGASVLETDRWSRGPLDVAHDNGENSLVQVLQSHVSKQPSNVQTKVKDITEHYQKVKNDKPVIPEETKQQQAKMIFGGLGGALKGLKKVEITEKTMFAKAEGKVDSSATYQDAKSTGKVLSKLIDFPGDKEEIKGHLANKEVNAGGRDAYGLTALHKFASWNKTEFIDLILPHLTKEQINAQDPDGKTALHWAVEMASVAAVSRLVECPELDTNIKDKKGRTPMGILETGSGNVIARLKKALLKEGE
jgi:ankyrin repeat protein